MRKVTEVTAKTEKKTPTDAILIVKNVGPNRAARRAMERAKKRAAKK